MSSRAASLVKRAVREPLTHFLAVGVLLLGANALIHGPERGPPGEAIDVSKGAVGQIVESYLLLAGRLPSSPELQALVDDYITEEISYREAVAMGLDADDTIVRRRMRQKLEFLIEDASASSEPSQAELQQWLAAHAEAYRAPERRAIRQVLASSDRRGAQAEADARSFLATISSGADPARLGDASMLPAATPLTTQEGAASLYGADFAAAVFAHQGEGWFGPVPSPFGQHIVLVMDVAPSRAASLQDIQDKVRGDLIEARRDRTRDDFHARMRQRYKISIDWPEPYVDLPAVADPAPKTKRAPPEIAE